MKSVIVTGSGGFIGKRFAEYSKSLYNLSALSLRDDCFLHQSFEHIDCILHLAGKAHDLNCKDDSQYHIINFELTKQLADKARQDGVPHFIYVSSVKVYGSEDRGLINEKSECIPEDAYGKSKLQAEQYVQSIATDKFKVAIVRPPMVYGAGVKGNMDKLIHLCSKNHALPFGNCGNLRSMVFVDNLVELLNTIIDQEATGIFIPGDKKPLSTDALITLIKKALGKEPKLIAIPGVLRKIIKKIKPKLYKRLFGSFVIDTKNTNATLNFVPPYSTEFGIKKMCENGL